MNYHKMKYRHRAGVHKYATLKIILYELSELHIWIICVPGSIWLVNVSVHTYCIYMRHAGQIYRNCLPLLIGNTGTIFL